MNERISAPVRRVEVAGRLVGEDDLRAAGEGPGDGDALLLATGELARPVREAVAETDGVDDLVEPRRVGLAAGERHRERDVLDRGERRHQVEGLEDEADPVAAQLGELRSSSVPRSVSPMKHVARGEVVEPGDACISVDLPEPDGPMMAVKRPVAKSTVDAVEGADLGLALAVDLDGVDGASGRRAVAVDCGAARVEARSGRRARLDGVDGMRWVSVGGDSDDPRSRGIRAGSSAAGGSPWRPATYVSRMTRGSAPGRDALAVPIGTVER